MTTSSPADAASGAAPARRTQGLRWRMRKARNRMTRRLGVRFGARFIKGLARRCEHIELERHHRERLEEAGAMLIALWHGRGVVGQPFFHTDRTTVLVSASEDGSVATTILGRLGYEIIRGSSSRGGVRALRAMISCLRRGKDVAITPDGPRGPMHSMSPGVVFLARATGAPVLPVGFGYDRSWHLSTWDHYTIPRPRARVVACYGEPIVVPREATSEELEECSARIRTSIREAERRAFAHLDLEPDWVEWAPEEPQPRREEDGD